MVSTVNFSGLLINTLCLPHILLQRVPQCILWSLHKKQYSSSISGCASASSHAPSTSRCACDGLSFSVIESATFALQGNRNCYSVTLKADHSYRCEWEMCLH